MKRYIYKAKDKEGRVISGEVEASDPYIAAKLVRNRGLTVISIRAKLTGPLALIDRMRNRITHGDIVDFTRQLATMINAGLPITDALVILRNQSKGSMQKLVAQILADVEGGQSLSNSMKKHPKVFDKTYVALIKSGEVGGVLDRVISRLAENLEKEREFRGQVKTAMIYPVIIVIGMIIVGFIMMVFVIPRLLDLYSDFDAELPMPTLILMAIANFFATFWPFIIIGVAAGFYAFQTYRRTVVGRRKIDEYIFKIPIIGDLQRMIILTDLTRSLSLMVGAGVSILEGLTITSDSVDNVVIGDALKDAAVKVEKGFPVAYSFAKHPDAFPYILSQMIAVGEETGKLDEVLEKVSHVFEVESDQKVKGLTAAVEPAIMVVLGIGVGFLVIAIILPIYNLTSQF